MSESENGRPTPGPAGTNGAADGPAPTENGASRGADPGNGSPTAAGRTGVAAPAAKPRIGDTRPAPSTPPGHRPPPSAGNQPGANQPTGDLPAGDPRPVAAAAGSASNGSPASTARTSPPPRRPKTSTPTTGTPPAADADADEGPGSSDGQARRSRRRRGGRDRKGRSVGRYLMCVHVQPGLAQIAMLEGRSLVEHYVSRAADETTQIDGNIYRGRVQNVLPGMEAAFVDIGIPKNAVLYRGDVRYDVDDVDGSGQGQKAQPRIEQVLRAGQTILCQVTKNPIGAKGARLTQEVSLPGRFAVLVPNSSAFGISKRLGDNERRRLRKIIDDVRPAGHGLIVRTAAEGASEDELRRDVNGLLQQWDAIDAEARRSDNPGLLYREPDLTVRLLREELNSEYRGVIIDDHTLYEQVRSYVATVSPELADRVEYYDPDAEAQPLFERYHVHEQLHKALDRKVWLPSGGSLIIERTEALTVIDVNTGKNVGKTNLEETVYRNNLEAAEEVARQLRLRDIGGIIVIDFIDMEIRENRDKVATALRNALARDKTRTQVFDISELGLVEMTRKRISEGLIESLSTVCEVCNGRGIVLDASAL
jgi:ribonuclease E